MNEGWTATMICVLFRFTVFNFPLVYTKQEQTAGVDRVIIIGRRAWKEARSHTGQPYIQGLCIASWIMFLCSIGINFVQR